MEGAAGLHHRPRWKSHEAYICHDVKTWDSSDHYPIYATTQEDEIAEYVPARKERDLMEAKN